MMEVLLLVALVNFHGRINELIQEENWLQRDDRIYRRASHSHVDDSFQGEEIRYDLLNSQISFRIDNDELADIDILL